MCRPRRFADTISPVTNVRTGSRQEWLWLAGSFVAIAALVILYAHVLFLTNHTIVALSLLLIVFTVAMNSTVRVAIAASVSASISFNFFFLPPTGTLAIADPQNWFALFTLLVVSVVVSRLSAEVRTRAQDALRSELLASLSHDLRTRLTAVTVAAANLDSSGLCENERQAQIDVIRTEVGRLNRLFENIVDLAKIEARGISPEPEWVQPGEIVQNVRHALGRQLADHPIAADADERAVVRVDPRLVSAALSHLVENAAQYSREGTPIEIRGWVEASELRLSVRDRGPGLAPGDLARVFDRFYRGQSGQNRFGSGMGLAITKGLVTAQRGRVWAENHAGGGAVFTLAIPVEARSLAREEGDEA